MANIYAESNDGQISKESTSNWTGARAATDGDTASAGGTNSSLAVYASHGAARGGGATWKVHRSFFEFDTSGISVAPELLSFKLYGRSHTTGDFFVVKSVQTGGSDNSGGSLVVDDYDSLYHIVQSQSV